VQCVVVCRSVLQFVRSTSGASLLQSIAECCSVQCAAVRDSLLQSVRSDVYPVMQSDAECSSVSVLQCVAVHRSVLQYVAVCCSVLQCVALCCNALQYVAVCCGMLQYLTVCCSVLQCVAMCCSVLRVVSIGCQGRSYEVATMVRPVHCNTLQHSATNCNRLQHTATDCSTATQCITLYHPMCIE